MLKGTLNEVAFVEAQEETAKSLAFVIGISSLKAKKK